MKILEHATVVVLVDRWDFSFAGSVSIIFPWITLPPPSHPPPPEKSLVPRGLTIRISSKIWGSADNGVQRGVRESVERVRESVERARESIERVRQGVDRILEGVDGSERE